jgi:hypothetical protein
MDLPDEGIEVGGHSGHEGLALAGLHLGDLALVDDDATEKLDVEGAQPDGAPRGLAHHRERLRQDVIERLAVGESVFKFIGLRSQLIVGELLDFGLQSIDLIHNWLKLSKLLFVGLSEDPIYGALEKFHLRNTPNSILSKMSLMSKLSRT